MSRTHRGVPIAGLAALVLVSGCRLDTRRVETKVAEGLLQQLGVKATVQCPADVPAKQGSSFPCQAVTGDGSLVPVTVTVLDDSGERVEWKTPTLLRSAVAEQQMAAWLAKRGPAPASVACPKARVIRTGDAFACEAAAPDGRRVALAATVQDDQGTVAWAIDDPLKKPSDAAREASARFLALAAGSERSGRVPRQSDPAAGPLLDAMLDIRAIPPVPAPWAEIEALNEWMLAVLKVLQVYLLAGTGQTGFQVADGPAVEARSNRNLVDFAPETARLVDALVTILRAEGAVIDQRAAGGPDAEDAVLARVRSGYAQFLGGLLSSLAVPGLSPDWRRARVHVLAEAAPDLARLVAPDDGSALVAQARQLAAVLPDPATRAGLARVADALAAGRAAAKPAGVPASAPAPAGP